jgi:hypothetical protein
VASWTKAMKGRSTRRWVGAVNGFKVARVAAPHEFGHARCCPVPAAACPQMVKADTTRLHPREVFVHPGNCFLVDVETVDPTRAGGDGR